MANGPADTEPMLRVRDLRAYYQMHYFGVSREVRAVDDVSLDVGRNEIYGLAGELSSGKTSFIKTIAGANRPPLNVLGGSVRYRFLADDIFRLNEEALGAVRWKHLSYIMQGSMNVLNPVRRVRESFVDFAFRHMGGTKREFIGRVETHLERLRLAPSVLDAFPHELSGGMRQRITIALATICRPEFIIADEPTTALDVVVQKDVLTMIRQVQREIGSSMIFVTHDMAVHANMTDRLGIMYAGRLVEEGRTADVFRTPRHPYTAHLIASLPRIGDVTPRKALGGTPPNLAEPPGGMPLPPALSARHGHLQAREPGHGDTRTWPSRRLLRRAASASGEPDVSGALLAVENVTRTYAMGGLFGLSSFQAVDDVSFALEADRPEIFTIIGESGSGKTTLARMVLGLVAPSAGVIRFRGEDVAKIGTGRARTAFMAAMQPIFQNPFEAFNPLKRLDRYLLTTARRFCGARRGAEAEALADEALRKVGLSFAEVRGRFPHELSGGQLQRVAVARALIPGPALIVADEPVSMVDASLRMSIVNLFRTLRDDLGISIIYITHDLATAYYISDRIIIMQKGKVVEGGDARSVLDNPQHPYSILLKSAVLSPDVTEEGSVLTVRQELTAPATGNEPNTSMENLPDA